MKRILMIAILALTMLAMSGSPAGVMASDNFVAVLSGGDEVPQRDTNARGVATFKLSKDGTELGYTLIVANIENVVFAHIHCGPVGVSRPVGVTLLMEAPPSGRFDGVLAEGTITAPDPSAAAACGWSTLTDVLDAMNSGNAYVNVHTNDGIAPPNTGPGDFPAGEIRGQIK